MVLATTPCSIHTIHTISSLHRYLRVPTVRARRALARINFSAQSLDVGILRCYSCRQPNVLRHHRLCRFVRLHRTPTLRPSERFTPLQLFLDIYIAPFLDIVHLHRLRIRSFWPVLFLLVACKITVFPPRIILSHGCFGITMILTALYTPFLCKL